MDKFPIGVIMNKGMTVRSAQQHGQKYVPRLLDLVARGELDPSFLVTHRFSLEDAPHGYELFKHKADGCVRVVFTP
jgi:threonine dehydrogenase-like Zn-dependent dehydrogenase